MNVSRDELVAAWLEYHAVENGRDELFWAFEQLDDLVRSNPDEAWAIVLDLIARSSSDPMLANVAAGPLEDLIRRHPSTIRDRVEQQARRDPKFRRCLTGVWYGEDLPLEVRDMIKKYTATVVNKL